MIVRKSNPTCTTLLMAMLSLLFAGLHLITRGTSTVTIIGIAATNC
jgi:hypothetical protein